MRISLGKKLVIGGIALVGIPLIVVGAFTLYRASRGVTGLAEEGVAGVTQSLAGMAQLAMQQEIKVAQTVARNALMSDALAKLAKEGPEAAKGALAQASGYLAEVRKGAGEDYETVLMVTPRGVVVADSLEGKSQGQDLSAREYIKQALAGRANASQVVRSSLTKHPVAMVAAPVGDKDGKAVGGILIAVNVKFLADRVAGAKLGRTGYAYLTNAEGVVIAHRDAKLVLAADINKLAGMERFAPRVIKESQGVDEYVFQGAAKVAAFATVPLNGWKLVATQDRDEFMEDVRDIQYGFFLVGGLSLLAAVLLLLWFGRSISRPITLVADGLGGAAEQVTIAAGQVSASSQSLAQGTSEQAAALEETSSSLEELSSMTKNNADHASQANALTGESTRAMEGVGRNMAELNRSMQEISQASQETSKIIKTIDEIAFQTNLLALNAAVEAARAGEAGAGFAVVAGEVRNLAMRAAEAAKNTAGLIEGTIAKTKQGSELVERSNQAFTGVAAKAGKVTELVGEIAAASSEQTQGIEQVNQAMQDMDKVTQQNAASAEQSAAASEELNAQAETMKGFVMDLVALVGGGTGGGKAAARRRKGPEAEPPVDQPARRLALAAPRPASSARPDPKQALPLEDEESFKDF